MITAAAKILADPEFREILYCIRCGCCLNICLVYAKIGGHAYGYPYCGPIGAVVTPLLVGINRAKDLCLGETLCGACRDICPVDIDQPRMLLALRSKLADGDPQWNVKRADPLEKAIFKAWSWDYPQAPALCTISEIGPYWPICIAPIQGDDPQTAATILTHDAEEKAKGLTNCMTFITGPSKTADIEAHIVHGAHGPREMYLFVLTG